jgi:23S rRNA pseudouridine1911/1915/1917 synthase
MHVCPEGKFAHTKLQVLAKWESGSLLDIELITGRTHQIRVHLKHIGCPILGDPVYGRTSVNEKLKITRQFLHAKTLSFIHPRTSQQIVVEAPLAPDMQTFIAKAFS